jgi:hypothetical protein
MARCPAWVFYPECGRLAAWSAFVGAELARIRTELSIRHGVGME